MRIRITRFFMICVVLAASTSFASPFLIVGAWYLTNA